MEKNWDNSSVNKKSANLAGQVQSPKEGQSIKKVASSLTLWEFSSLGIEFFFIFILFIILGNYLDKYFSIQPIGLILGLIIGFFYGLFYLIARTRKINKPMEEKDNNV